MRRLVICLSILAGCHGASPSVVTGLVQANGQYVPGPLPAPSGGPDVVNFTIGSPTILSGQIGKQVSGYTPVDATAVAVFVEGDSGYWLTRPGAPDPTFDNKLQFALNLTFAHDLAPGKYKIIAAAIDAQGRYGKQDSGEVVTLLTPNKARLKIALKWDVNADLDFHLITPDGAEVWSKNTNNVGMMGDRSTGGQFSFDSNGGCIIDGAREESVIWTAQPPSGHYITRVDAFSLCGEVQSYYTVEATLDDQRIGFARGVMHEQDTWNPHVAGSGTTALEFDIP